MLLNERIVAIHQPNFFPWLGYFDKIHRADIFVFMDDVLYPKSGNSMGTYTNRVKLIIGGSEKWLSVPVVREDGNQIIKDVKINNEIKWKNKMLKSIEYSYKKHEYFQEVYPFIEEMISGAEGTIADFNVACITSFVSKLNIQASFVRQSSLDTCKSSTDLLIEIIKKVSGTAYLCGGGASGYQVDTKISHAGIELGYQNFKHPVYMQKNVGFHSGLSTLDVLMNHGYSDTEKLIKQNAGL